MLDTKQLGTVLSQCGFNFYSGVPCSFLKYLINYAINDKQFLMATNEGDAVAICAGAFLGGQKSVLLCQNSGLANTVSPLTSLNYIFKIPILGFVSLRGEKGLGDEPQHELMGQITTELLDVMKIKWEFLSPDFDVASQQIKRANDLIENNESFFFVVKKGTFAPVELDPSRSLDLSSSSRLGTGSIYSDHTERANASRSEGLNIKRLQILQKLSELKDNKTIFISSTGFASRELFEVKDDEQNFYMVGSMGCASSIGLGLSLSQKNKDIVVIEGDGAALMRMGSMASNAYYGSGNMLHIVLDNNAHESTGGQMTVSGCVDFVGLADDVGYKKSIYIHDLYELEKEYKNWKENKVLTFFYIKIVQGKKENLGRPKIKPYEVKERLMEWLKKQ